MEIDEISSRPIAGYLLIRNISIMFQFYQIAYCVTKIGLLLPISVPN